MLRRIFPHDAGPEVRLKNAYIVKCTGCKKNEAGEIEEVYCEYDPLTKSGMPESNRKVKGTLHWVSCAHCQQAEVRLYDRLWKVENPRDELAAIREAKNCSALEAMKEMMNPDSLTVLTHCYVENMPQRKSRSTICNSNASAISPRQGLHARTLDIQPHRVIERHMEQAEQIRPSHILEGEGSAHRDEAGRDNVFQGLIPKGKNFKPTPT